MKRSYFGVAGISVVVAVIGVFAPILWDWYKARTSLEIREIARTVIASSPQELDNLRFMYAGKLVPSISRIELEVRNSGRTPIRSEDVVAPLSIQVNGQIISVESKRQSPSDLGLKLRIGERPGQVFVDFPLLNPGDVALVSILGSTDKPKFGATARIAGLDSVTISSSVKDVPVKVRPGRDWTFYVVAVFTAFSILCFIASVDVLAGEVAFIHMVRNGLFKIPLHESEDAFKDWCAKMPSSLKASELKSVAKVWRDGVSSGEDLHDVAHRAHLALVGAATRSSNMKSGVLFFGIMVAVGVIYIFYRLW